MYLNEILAITGIYQTFITVPLCMHPLECRQAETKVQAPVALLWMHCHAHLAPLFNVMRAALLRVCNCCWLIFNETLKYNLWILMSCQMMPKRWFSIIISTTLPPSVASASASTTPPAGASSPVSTTTFLAGWLSVCQSGPAECKINGLRIRLVPRGTSGGVVARPFVCLTAKPICISANSRYTLT